MVDIPNQETMVVAIRRTDPYAHAAYSDAFTSDDIVAEFHA